MEEINSTPTPHNSAVKGDFAKTVLMPGDPLRAKYIAETYLTDAKLVNNVRGVQGYTGYYNGKRVSVMASGMGMPSIGIYSYELYNFYGVENIIRIGSAGGLHPDLNLFDIVIAQASSYDSDFPKQFAPFGTYAPIGDYGLIRKAADTCEKNGYRYMVGNILSSDSFYGEAGPEATMKWQKMGIIAVEMESAALYCNAARAGKKALCICTISDLFTRPEVTTSEQRQTAFNDMMKVALEIAE